MIYECFFCLKLIDGRHRFPHEHMPDVPILMVIEGGAGPVMVPAHADCRKEVRK